MKNFVLLAIDNFDRPGVMPWIVKSEGGYLKFSTKEEAQFEADDRNEESGDYGYWYYEVRTIESAETSIREAENRF